MLSALAHLHDNHFVHRDVAARNLLLSGPIDSPDLEVVLGDLGMARKIKKGQTAVTEVKDSSSAAYKT